MGEGEARFGFGLKVGVESFPWWSKTSNGNNVEKCRGNHPTTKVKGRYEHVGIVPWPSS